MWGTDGLSRLGQSYLFIPDMPDAIPQLTLSIDSSVFVVAHQITDSNLLGRSPKGVLIFIVVATPKAPVALPCAGSLVALPADESLTADSFQLRDIWLHTASLADGKETNESKSRSSVPSGYARVDVLKWLGRATLDAIGLAGETVIFASKNSAAHWSVKDSDTTLTR
jgi:hypothetical protein